MDRLLDWTIKPIFRVAGAIAEALTLSVILALWVPGSAQALDAADIRNYREAVFMEAIAKSTDPEDFKDYLSNFPNGLYAGIARRKIDALSTESNVAAASASLPASGESTFCAQLKQTTAILEKDQFRTLARVFQILDVGPACKHGRTPSGPYLHCESNKGLTWTWYMEHITQLITCYPGFEVTNDERNLNTCRSNNRFCDYVIKIPDRTYVKRISIFMDFNSGRMTRRGLQFFSY